MKRRAVRHIILLLSLVLAFSCIKEFNPQLESGAAFKYVVSGRVTDQEGWHIVDISLSSPVENPEYLPVSNCLVSIQDDNGNSFELHEYRPGEYKVWMQSEDLVHGRSYRVRVITPDGSELVSDYDRMAPCPPLDSVYYLLEDLPTQDPTYYHRVMQIYVDLQAEGYECQFYKWEVEETWEYHSRHALEYYYDGTHYQIYPPDSSEKVCWINGLKPEVYTLSTTSLASNYYRLFPLNWIDGASSRLGVLYSMLVRQLALSQEAYYYWEQLRINSTQEGGLYEKQPLAIKGNIHDLVHPDKEVLGFFYAAGESSRRYFYKEIEGIELTFNDWCQEDDLGMFGWQEFRPSQFPIYYYYNEMGGLKILNSKCIKCTLRGGKTEKPDFWP